jgi:hypothetical protein
MKVSQDATVGADQSSTTFWANVCQAFEVLTNTKGRRTVSAIEGQWKKLQKAIKVIPWYAKV